MSKPPPTPLWQIIDAVVTLFSRAYMIARARAASCPSLVLRLMARRDHTHWEARMLEREMGVFRAHRTRLEPHRRPQYNPEQRAEIIQIMRLRGWSAKQTAKFIAGLKLSLTEGALDERQAAIRRCVETIKLDHENQQAIIGIWKLPLIVGGSQVLDVEHVIVIVK